jgi:hypothetical protein
MLKGGPESMLKMGTKALPLWRSSIITPTKTLTSSLITAICKLFDTDFTNTHDLYGFYLYQGGFNLG